MNDGRENLRVRDAMTPDRLLLLLVTPISPAKFLAPMARTQVYEVMQKPAVDRRWWLKWAMRRFGLSHCVVLEGQTIVGIVSL